MAIHPAVARVLLDPTVGNGMSEKTMGKKLYEHFISGVAKPNDACTTVKDGVGTDNRH